MITAFLVDGNLKTPHGLLHVNSLTRPLSCSSLLLTSDSSATLNFSTQFLASTHY